MSNDQLVANFWSNIDNQPGCPGANPFDTSEGVSFPLYRWEANQDFSCRLAASACEINCSYIWGVYNSDDGTCNELKKLKQVCAKVEFKYVEDLPAADAEIVSAVRYTTGCYIDGNIGLYETVPLDSDSNGIYHVSFD